MTDQLLDVISHASDDGVPHYGTCTLVVGDGTMKVEFRNGRAKVPAHIAEIIANNPQIDVIGLSSVPAAPASVQGDESAVSGEVIAAQNVRIRELEAALATNASADAEPDSPEGWTEVNAAAVDDAARAEQIRLAQEHLEAEGEHVPDPVSESGEQGRVGFDAETTDGQPRCQAAKADGSQCSNPAKEGAACQLGKHKEQLA